VDVAALKSEFYTNTKKRTVFTEIKSANNAKLNQLGSIFPSLTNFIVNQSLLKGMGSIKTRSPIIGSKII
jgi:hypothetical protein